MKERKKENRFSGMTPEEIKLEAKRQIVRSTFLALAALIVIGVACYAWFANNRSVTASMGPVSVARDGFELASVGTAGIFDGQIPDDYTVKQGEIWPDAEALSGAYYTAGNHAILWQMSDDSNLMNQASLQENNTLNPGIRPGSSGTLEFYVIPNRNTAMTIDAYLDIIPVQENGTGSSKTYTPLEPDSSVWRLLRGHLLFRYKYADQNIQLTELKDGHFQIDVPEGQKSLKVTLLWEWPYTLAEAKALVGDGLITGSPQYFLHNGIDDTTVNAEELSDIQKKDYYNNADQHIGETIDFIVLRLRASMR